MGADISVFGVTVWIIALSIAESEVRAQARSTSSSLHVKVFAKFRNLSALFAVWEIPIDTNETLRRILWVRDLTVLNFDDLQAGTGRA